MDELVSDVTKEYTDMFKIILYKHPYAPHKKQSHDEKPKLFSDGSDESVQRSVRRSRTAINDYVLCNEFDMFVTFTFDPKKVNRYDLLSTYQKMQSWLWRQRRKYENFRYIVVPEKHKDGAIHFHALVGGYDGPLKKTKVIQNNRRVYNLPSYRFGFTNAQYLDDDKQKAIAYLCKYITKDMELISNRRRYWCSKNLQKPLKYRNRIYDMGLALLLNHKTMVHETDFNVIYHVPKDLLVR